MLVQELVKQNQEKEEKEERVQAEVKSLRKETEELRKTIQAWRQEALSDLLLPPLAALFDHHRILLLLR